jgi:hypothetical protein
MPEYRNAGMPEKSQSALSISTGIKLPQSGISIPGIRSVCYCWSRIRPTLPSYVSNYCTVSADFREVA